MSLEKKQKRKPLETQDSTLESHMKTFFVALAFRQMSTSSLHKVHMLSIFAREFEKGLVRDIASCKNIGSLKLVEGRKQTSSLANR